jgi:uncharacterized protein (TIGR02596 family)
VRTSKRSAFTLVELLIVITIIVIMASLMGPTLNSTLRGTALTQASDKVIGVLSLARQTAVSKAQTVEVRFYSYTNSELPGDTGQGHGLQAFTVDDTGTNFTPITKPQILPNSVIISTNTYFSLLMGNDTNGTPTNTIPRAGTNYTYSSFKYYRSGSTSLASSSSTNVWGVTVVNASDSKGTNDYNLPLNYTTIVIDPYNGSLKTYRPHL